MKLEVHQARDEEVFKDIVRIHKSARGKIPVGEICKLTVSGRSRFLAVRGLPDTEQTYIRLGEVDRDRLGLEFLKSYEFQIHPAGWFEQFLWAYKASDPALRLASIMGVWAFILGVFGLALAIWSLYLAYHFAPTS